MGEAGPSNSIEAARKPPPGSARYNSIERHAPSSAMANASILGIESSCDETGAAVVRSGQTILSNIVFSQIATHQPYGGVVPELASREHLRAIVPVVRKALADSGQTYESR